MSTLRLSIPQVCEALSLDNKHFASRSLQKPIEDLTTQELLEYYITHSDVGMTVIGFSVSQHEPDQLPLFPITLRESTELDPHKFI